MHKCFANKSTSSEGNSYKFKFPPNMNVIEAMQNDMKKSRQQEDRPFIGMNRIITNLSPSIDPEIFKKPSLIFDSLYECGNLDMVFQIKENEYDLYMRVDSNTRGHH